MAFIGRKPTNAPLTSDDIPSGIIGASDLAAGLAKLTWDSSIKTASTFTASVNSGYFVDTTSNACTITLPASATAGDTIILVDYARNWGTNKITINQNSLNFQGYTSPNPEYNTSGQSVTLVYSGTTKGWIPTVDDDVTNEVPQTVSVDYLIVAGGGGGGGAAENGSTPAAGAGAGGMKTGTTNLTKGNVFTITVGDGGAGQTSATNVVGNNGSSSSIAGTGLTTISTSGGGGGGGGPSTAGSGGSGGGQTNGGVAGNGISGEGNNGGANNSAASGGGGGKGAAGQSAPSSSQSGNGGDGSASSITGSSVTYAGGGGGGGTSNGPVSAGTGGSGGGGAGGGQNSAGTSGTVNTGGGGGGGGPASGSSYTSSSGGKGVVIIRLLTADYTGTTTGSPTVTTDGSYKVLTYTGTGSYTA